MSTATSTEFNPEYFKAIFGEDAAEWKEFVQVNLKTYRNGYQNLQSASEHRNMSEVKEIRHALGPTLQQWNAVTLEQGLLALDMDNIAANWPPLRAEFEALISALEGL
jgi:hypothetical protein